MIRPHPAAFTGTDLFVLAVIAAILMFYALPLLWVLVSGRTRGMARFGWLIMVLAFSWLGFAAFLIFTQKEAD